MIPYGRQEISDDDIEAVVNVLRSEFITQGPTVEKFEDELRNCCGASHAVAMSSATAALHLAYRSLGLTNGDIVWTTPITFVATANGAVYCGADVQFVDIDLATFNISVERLRERLEIASKNRKLPRVLTVVHLAGQSCDMREIRALSKEYGFSVIEDASHAIGGTYLQEPVGSCRYSDITIFSFHPVKIITTGEGGAALTNDPDLARRLRLLRSHGITRDPNEMKVPNGQPWYYEQIDLGFNYRLTDIQAALGQSQLKRLADYVSRRNQIAAFYTKRFENLSCEVQEILPSCRSAYHLFILRLSGSRTGNGADDRRVIIEDLRRNGVATNLHYIPVYRHPFYSKKGTDYGLFPNAERYYQTAITIPLFSSMSDREVEHVAHSVVAAFQKMG